MISDLVDRGYLSVQYMYYENISLYQILRRCTVYEIASKVKRPWKGGLGYFFFFIESVRYVYIEKHQNWLLLVVKLKMPSLYNFVDEFFVWSKISLYIFPTFGIYDLVHQTNLVRPIVYIYIHSFVGISNHDWPNQKTYSRWIK